MIGERLRKRTLHNCLDRSRRILQSFARPWPLRLFSAGIWRRRQYSLIVYSDRRVIDAASLTLYQSLGGGWLIIVSRTCSIRANRSRTSVSTACPEKRKLRIFQPQRYVLSSSTGGWGISPSSSHTARQYSRLSRYAIEAGERNKFSFGFGPESPDSESSGGGTFASDIFTSIVGGITRPSKGMLRRSSYAKNATSSLLGMIREIRPAGSGIP
jgi:hypothetical protein